MPYGIDDRLLPERQEILPHGKFGTCNDERPQGAAKTASIRSDLHDWERIANQLKEVAEGQEGAWGELLVSLSPVLEGLARRQPLGRLRDDEDIQRDIVTKVIGKLHAGENRVVKKFVDHETPPPLKAWIRVLVRSAAIDVMRGRPEFQRGNKEKLPHWFSLATLVTSDGVQRPDSIEAKQREVEKFMTKAVESTRQALADDTEGAVAHLAREWNIPPVHTRRIVKRVDHYPVVLSMVLAGHTYVEIAESIALSRREVALMVEYIEEFFHACGFAA